MNWIEQGITGNGVHTVHTIYVCIICFFFFIFKKMNLLVKIYNILKHKRAIQNHCGFIQILHIGKTQWRNSILWPFVLFLSATFVHNTDGLCFIRGFMYLQYILHVMKSPFLGVVILALSYDFVVLLLIALNRWKIIVFLNNIVDNLLKPQTIHKL